MRRLLAVLALLLISHRDSSAQALAPASPDPRAALLVNAQGLAPQLRDQNLVLLHVGAAAEYAAAHIPGARLVSVADVSVSDTARKLNVEMPGADTLRARLAALGITDDSRVVVYFAKDMVYQTTRILFTLFYAGLGERAALLDGGMAAWTAAGQPTVAETPAPPAAGTLAALRLRNFVVDAAFVHSKIGAPGIAIVDARDSVFYTGARQGGSAQAPHRAGHVPSARSVPWQVLYDEGLQLKPRDELARIFAAAGVKPGDLVIGYCHTGQQATAMLLAARSLGHPVLLYDGSFQDWSARTERPVEK